MSGCRNMMANQTGGETVAIIQPTSRAMSLMCVPLGMAAVNSQNAAILKANSQQRTIKTLSVHEQPRQRKWLSASSATDTTLRQQNPTNSGTAMYRDDVKR